MDLALVMGIPIRQRPKSNMYMVIYCKVSEVDDEYQIDGPFIGSTKSTKVEAGEAAKEVIKKTSKSVIPIVEVYNLNTNSIKEAKAKMAYKAERVTQNIKDSQRSNRIVSRKKKKK